MTFSTYQLQKLIKPLYPTYTEVELAERFSLTISDVRQYLDGPIPLNSSAWNEIVALYPNASDYALTKLYNTTNHQIKKWSEGKGQDKIRMSQIEVQELLDQGKSIKEVSKLSNVSMKEIRSTLPKLAKRQMPSKEQLLAMLDTSTHEEIAEELGVSRSWVTKQISVKHKPSTPNKIKDWNAVEEYLKANSLTATANNFGVSPSAIIHRRNRNAKRTK